MPPIDPSSPLLAQIRAHAASWRRGAARPVDVAARPSESAPQGTTEPAQAWLAQVAQSVLAIRRDDPNRRRKAFRVYLQALLARECGVRRIEDPEFQDLVDRVLDTMESDPRLKGAVETAGDLLLESAGPQQP